MNARCPSGASGAETFSIGQLRRRVHDLYEIRPAIYWTDFLLSLTVAYSTATVYLLAPSWWMRLAALPVAVCGLYRVSLFMHEIVHFRRGQMRAFKVAWNVLAGVPMLTPSFFYESHNSHHNTQHYGTQHDGEYLPFGSGTWGHVLAFLLQIVLQPILVTCRFVLLTPISFLHPRLRQWTLENASSFVINFRYRREVPENAPRWAWALMDGACHLRAAAIFVFIALGLNPWTRVLQLYSLAVLILALNHFRTLAAHRYTGTGEAMSHTDQLFDSVDITGDRFFTELLCPLGLRYHALHHLFPTMPYYNLGRAHRRLLAELPADSPYRSLVYPSYWSVIRELLGSINSHSSQPQDSASSRRAVA